MPFPRPKKRFYSEDELYEYAVGALGRRMRTVAELKRLFRARVEEPESEYGQTLIELVIRRLKDRGYLNDSHYAAYFSSLRRDNQKFGRQRVVTDLKIKGVHGDVIEKAVDAAFEGVSEEKQAREFLRKKRLVKPKDQKEAARIFRQLARGGFGPKTIFSILKHWNVDEETLTELESESA
ncbi:MAG: regulatory protein RecX [Candidatus Sulfotelmatobacter sp.]|jgi:regulatory protein